MFFIVATLLLATNVQSSTEILHFFSKVNIDFRLNERASSNGNSSFIISPIMEFFALAQFYESVANNDKDDLDELGGMRISARIVKDEPMPNYCSIISACVDAPSYIRFNHLSIPLKRLSVFEMISSDSEFKGESEKIRSLSILKINEGLRDNKFSRISKLLVFALASNWVNWLTEDGTLLHEKPLSEEERKWEHITAQEVSIAIDQGELQSTARDYLLDVAMEWITMIDDEGEAEYNSFHCSLELHGDGPWEYPFFTKHIRDFPNKRVMQRNGIFPYCERDGMQAIAIPYNGSQVYMLILLPNEKLNVEELARRITGKEVFQYFNETLKNRCDVSVTIPKFSIKTLSHNIDPDEAFLPKWGFIQRNIHLEVHEYGTGNVNKTEFLHSHSGECTGPAPAKRLRTEKSKPRLFFVDRPFLFAQVDVRGLVRLFGYYNFE